jgi:hypothetical protein
MFVVVHVLFLENPLLRAGLQLTLCLVRLRWASRRTAVLTQSITAVILTQPTPATASSHSHIETHSSINLLA